jgi:hypothetical protein
MTRHLPNAEGAPAGYVELEAAAPWERGPPAEQVVECVKAAASTFRELEALVGRGR